MSSVFKGLWNRVLSASTNSMRTRRKSPWRLSNSCGELLETRQLLTTVDVIPVPAEIELETEEDPSLDETGESSESVPNDVIFQMSGPTVIHTSNIEKSPRAKSRQTTTQTIETPYGPAEVTLRRNGTSFRGIAKVDVTPAPGVPAIQLSPIRIKGQFTNLQLAGTFTGSFELEALNGPKQRVKGQFNAGVDLLNPTNVKGHVTATVANSTVLDQDFAVPLSTILQLLQQT